MPGGRGSSGLKQDGRHWGSQCSLTLAKVIPEIRRKKRERESEVAQSCLTLCDPMDCSLLGSSFYGIFQARVLEWVAISFSGDLPDPGIEPRSPVFQADALSSEPPRKPP